MPKQVGKYELFQADVDVHLKALLNKTLFASVVLQNVYNDNTNYTPARACICILK